MGKNLDPDIKPKKKTTCQSYKRWCRKATHGSGRAGVRRRRSAPIIQTIILPSELSQKIPGETKLESGKTNHVNSKDPMHSINNADEGMTHASPLLPYVPFHPGPTYRPLLKPLDPRCLKVRRVHKVHLIQKIPA